MPAVSPLPRPRGSSALPERNALVEAYGPLAARLARRYHHHSESLEDLEQVAYLGLVLAADRFSPERGHPFTSFATPTILGELRRHLRDHGWAARVPRGIQEHALRVTKVTDDLSGALGRAPTPREVALETGLDLDRVIEAMLAGAAYAADSLDRRPGGDDDEREPLLARIGAVDPRYEYIDRAASIRPAVAKLSPPERTALAMRFFEDLPQSEIARRMGVSQMYVSRILRRTLEKLQRTARLAA